MNKDLLKKRYKKEKRFILIGRIAVSLTIIFLVILLGSILLRGISGFYTTNISLKTNLLEEIIDPAQNKNADEIFKASWRKVSRTAIYNILDDYNDSKNIEKSTRKEKRDFIRLFSRSSEFYVRDYTLKNINNIGEVVTINVPASSLVDQYLKKILETININKFKLKLSDIFNKLVFIKNNSILINNITSNQLAIYINDTKQILIELYKNNCWKMRDRVRFLQNNIEFEGILDDITDTFEILIKVNGELKKFNSGELSFSY